MSRRRFLASTTGAAAAFFVLSACSKDEHASRGESPGGTFAVPEETTIDKDAALETLGGEEFVFDVQTHYVNYDLAVAGGEWTSVFPFASCAEGKASGQLESVLHRRCVLPRDVRALGHVDVDPVGAADAERPRDSPPKTWCTPSTSPRRSDATAACSCTEVRTRTAVRSTPRSLGMTDLRDNYDIVAWKIYTMVPTDSHFYFDDHDPTRPQIGQRFIDHVREIGPPIICTHKGISSIVGTTPELADPSDIGPAAARNPDISFVVYHSGFEPDLGGKGPYDPNNTAPEGVDRLIRSLQQATDRTEQQRLRRARRDVVVRHARPDRRPRTFSGSC